MFHYIGPQHCSKHVPTACRHGVVYTILHTCYISVLTRHLRTSFFHGKFWHCKRFVISGSIDNISTCACSYRNMWNIVCYPKEWWIIRLLSASFYFYESSEHFMTLELRPLPVSPSFKSIVQWDANKNQYLLASRWVI